MKTTGTNFSKTTDKNINKPINHNLLKTKTMKNLLLTVLLLTTMIVANAQSIQSQAEKAGNEAFAGAMIRNVFIGIGIVLFLAWAGSKKSKDDKKV